MFAEGVASENEGILHGFWHRFYYSPLSIVRANIMPGWFWFGVYNSVFCLNSIMVSNKNFSSQTTIANNNITSVKASKIHQHIEVCIIEFIVAWFGLVC